MIDRKCWLKNYNRRWNTRIDLEWLLVIIEWIWEIERESIRWNVEECRNTEQREERSIEQPKQIERWTYAQRY